MTTTLTREEVLRRIAIAEEEGAPELASAMRRKFADLLQPPIPPKSQAILDKWITADEKMLAVKQRVGKLSRSNYPVLLEGPTGTGKEILANALHGERTGFFLAINCAAIQETLLESELFGHVRGAFTGAAETKNGLFREAQNGSVFLDEIGEMPLSIQAKLLRVLQERKVRRVGGTQEEAVNARVICATHRDLWKLVQQDKFREDLFYRLCCFHTKLTPLSERVGDIPLIVDAVAKRIEEELKTVKKFPRDITINPALLSGNVRSIEHIILRYHCLEELPV